MMNSAIQSITTKRKDARFWQYAFILQMLIFTATIIYIKAFPEPLPNILVVHENGYVIGKLEDFSGANQLHEDQAEIATLCLFQRSPDRRDYHERLGKLFGPIAYDKASEMFNSTRQEFQLKSLHQKVEIDEITILQVKGNSVLTKITGQLIRTGNFEEKPFIEVLKLDLEMAFIRNPDITANGFYPSIVQDFKATTTPITTR